MRTHRNRLRRVAGLGVLVAAVGLTGCDLDELLTIEDRDVVSPGTLEDPAVIDVVIAGAIGDFTSAFSGGDSYVTVSALITDEFFSSGTFTTRTATDRREQFSASNGNTSDAAYVDFQQARRSLAAGALKVADHEDFGPSSETYAELKALEGYTLVFLAEGWCSAVPISREVDGTFEYGPANTSSELLDSARVRFQASTSATANNLAALGTARALLDQGDYAGAAAAVSGVDTDWTYFINHSQSGTNNPIYSLQANGRYSQSDLEGGNGAPFREPEDPRAPWTEDPAGGFDEQYRLFLSNKYNDYDNPIVLASGVEARLIEAEAALAANDLGGMTDILNDLRADVGDIMASWVENYETFFPTPTLADLAAPGTAAAGRDLLFEERAFWLYLTGHRLGDLRRLVYQYGLPQDQVYPSGDYHKGGSYGADVVFEMDFDEANNPEYSLDSCVVTDASIN